MIYAIDYTIYKFRIFIDLEETNSAFPEYDFLNKRQLVLEKLVSLRRQIFNDIIIELIDHLIHFYSDLSEGGKFYLKHYSFSSIWEDMVLNYLKSNFKGIKDDKLEFGSKNTKKINFSKSTFHPNISNKSHRFSPDYYYEEDDMQLIFDAKYKTDIIGMDYKQIAYILFLKDYREESNQKPKYSETYSALILPSDKRSNRIHFRMDPLYSSLNKDIIISEEYLDIREVINSYL